MNPSEKLAIMALLYLVEGQGFHQTESFELMRGLRIKEPFDAYKTLKKKLEKRLEQLNDREQEIEDSWKSASELSLKNERKSEGE